MFRVRDFAEMNEMRMRQALYPREPKGDYFIFRFDEEIILGKIDIGRFSDETRSDRFPDLEKRIQHNFGILPLADFYEVFFIIENRLKR